MRVIIFLTIFCILRCTHWLWKVEWEMNIETFSFAFSNKLMSSQRTREELAHIIPMYGYIKNTVIIIKDIGRAIAYMDIPIKNTHFLFSKFLLGNSSCHSNIIEETKSPDIRAMSVMTRRSYDGEDGVYRLTRIWLAKCSYCFYCTSR